MDFGTLWRSLAGREAGLGDRIVPPSGVTAKLTAFGAGVMAFLAVFALALSLATGRLADRWAEGLAQTVTIRVSAPTDEIEAQTATVRQVLETTPGIAESHLLDAAEVEALLEPWFGPDVPVDALPVPRLVQVTTARGFDAEGLRLRLEAEAPGAVLDDHTRWRQPLVSAASRLRVLGWLSLVLIGAAGAAIVTLAAQATLAANGQVIRVMRLIGARDLTIAQAFVRRLTRRAALGAAGGTALGMLAIFALPDMQAAGGFLTGLGFSGWGWLWPLLIPPVGALVGFVATRAAALRMLREVR
ncbi:MULTISPECIES: ABC transporter permease [unclassified Paracoccus (in: a-proteobacteria)]|uniref:cell division protein FtsX n=1 Tax=unclassified Paracoccus (in: a-proteobacteria) TaxID=2688777 RepID=UPI0015FF5A94|nr:MULTISPECIES: cell division protein FtsX [unclassified Paracoccus (in: a-proteobacteria)]MBB1490706.1 cell division protein FtsX [Paracoccus sp. MC1854]MBB1497451.1 cell division protein FtsX [Paracoccus sp. MC1862]QQO46360.1 cell division protein FtsX [Paracoccus sp. MC1862]